MRAFMLSTAVALLIAFAPATGFAQDWDATMSTDAVRSYLPAESKRVIVVPAGDHPDDATDVAEALVASIDGQRDSTAVVVSGIARGAGDDEAILKRADSLAADVVLIVRVFKASEDGAATALGTFYAEGDEAFSAFAVESGEALEARKTGTQTPVTEKETPDESPKTSKDEKKAAKDGEQEPSEGVSQGASAAVESVRGDNEKSFETRLAALESRVLFVSEFRIHSTDGSTKSNLTFYRGIHRKEITPDQFFAEIDRPELAAQYKKAKMARTGIAIASVTGLLGGAVLLTHGAVQRGNCSGSRTCDNPSAPTAFMIGGGSALALGIGGLIALEATDPLPLSPSEARELAHDYNKELSEELDVPDSYEPFSTRREPVELEFGLVPLTDGAGVSLGGRF